MERHTAEIFRFASSVRFEDLPKEVVHECKRMLLDSFGVAIAALDTDKGRCVKAFADKFKSLPEAAIWGTSDRTSCEYAAFANAELTNALDFDALLFPTHAPPAVIPASIACGETVAAPGKEILLATAIGCELAIRLGKAIRGEKKVFESEVGSEVGKIPATRYSISPVGVVVLAGTAGASRVMGLEQDTMANALGLAAHFTPIPQAKWKIATQMPMPKYISAGWASLSQVSAISLARNGYTADTTFMDGDLGLWRFFGSDLWNPDYLKEGLGTRWKLLDTAEYKPYPCCRDLHIPLDCFIELLNKHNLQADEIDSVKVMTQSSLTGPLIMATEIKDSVGAQFSLPYCISVAAYRRQMSEWQDPETISDPRISGFMRRVSKETHPEFFKVQASEPGTNMTKVQVTARGRKFESEGKWPRGIPTPKSLRLTDEEIISKFEANASKKLSKGKIEKAISGILSSQDVEDISEIIQMITV